VVKNMLQNLLSRGLLFLDLKRIEHNSKSVALSAIFKLCKYVANANKLAC
jgi:hypothetical protein